MSSTPGASRQRAWITTAEVCDWLGVSRENRFRASAESRPASPEALT